MKSFLYDMLIEPFTEKGEWGMKMCCILGWIMTLLLTALIMAGVLNGINRIGRTEREGQGIVNHKCFEPAHYESYGKGQSRWVNDRWWLNIEKDDLEDCVCVTHSCFNQTRLGDKYCIRYYTGRLWKSLYIISFCGEEK